MLTMAPILSLRALDGTKPNTDGLGILYVVLAIIYTIILSTELVILYRHRLDFCVRIRGTNIIFAAVASLHIYLVIVLLVYPLNGRFPCAAEFWIMSLFLPFGMACFQSKFTSILRVWR